jgi:hypothetical protein
VFTKRLEDDSDQIVLAHVDDLLIMGTSDEANKTLHTTLLRKYKKVTWEEEVPLSWAPRSTAHRKEATSRPCPGTAPPSHEIWDYLSRLEARIATGRSWRNPCCPPGTTRAHESAKFPSPTEIW